MSIPQGHTKLDTTFILRTALIIKQAVTQTLQGNLGRQPKRIAHSGDTSFGLDLLAEKALADFFQAQQIPLALFTEDRGLVQYGQGEPRGLLVVDPIDGTRPALAGLGCSCVSVALARYSADPKMSDITIGCLVELEGPATFLAERGKGVVISGYPGLETARPSNIEDPERMFWSFELVGRPATETMAILEPLVTASGLEAGMFVLTSSSYSITRILLGRMDAYVDVGARILNKLPEGREKFLQAGRGRIVCLFPYDIAASVLLAEEAGCVVTDAHGCSLDDLPLIHKGERDLPSCVVASNEELHRRILEVIDRGFRERH
ncbi:inositol monophosphatase family protein [Candidatus Zixiibacteriota bacterium]